MPHALVAILCCLMLCLPQHCFRTSYAQSKQLTSEPLSLADDHPIAVAVAIPNSKLVTAREVRFLISHIWCHIVQVLRMRCTNDGHCAGLGDRLKGLSVAFWLVRPSESPNDHASCASVLAAVDSQARPVEDAMPGQ